MYLPSHANAKAISRMSMLPAPRQETKQSARAIRKRPHPTANRRRELIAAFDRRDRCCVRHSELMCLGDAMWIRRSDAFVGGLVMVTDPLFQGLAVALIRGAIVATLFTMVVVPILYRTGLDLGNTHENADARVQRRASAPDFIAVGNARHGRASGVATDRCVARSRRSRSPK
jgi:hypothetical protein